MEQVLRGTREYGTGGLRQQNVWSKWPGAAEGMPEGRNKGIMQK